MEGFISAVKEVIALKPEEENIIKSYFKLIEIKKDEHLLKQEQVCQNLYYIDSGLLHTYYLYDGKVVSSWFYKEDDIMTTWFSFLSQEPSFEFIQALEDSVIWSINLQDLNKLYRELPAMERFGRVLMEVQLAFIERFNKGYLFMTAKEKLALLTEYIPDVSLRVKLGLIAGFLGISQETLSRIRAQK